MLALSYAKQYDFLDIVGVYDSAEAALAETEALQPHVLLSDIDMENMSGLELRKRLMNIDACIFITAYPEFAVESFDMAALDFLVKPINAQRFDMAMQRLQTYLEAKHKSQLYDHSLNGDTIFLKDGHEQVKITPYEILYLEALRNYTGIVTGKKKYCILTPLSKLLSDKAFGNFVRVHRSYAVQKHFINKVTHQEVWLSNFKIPLGRNYRNDVEAMVGGHWLTDNIANNVSD
jgi:DNA-binding LytR/AlgR family response regulator